MCAPTVTEVLRAPWCETATLFPAAKGRSDGGCATPLCDSLPDRQTSGSKALDMIRCSPCATPLCYTMGSTALGGADLSINSGD
jgi:hypothetical protein